MERVNEPIILSNRYRLEDRQGSGGMAMVYRAYDLMLERPVAIKILRRDFSNDPDFRERFRQEAKAAANLSHPNIVTVHDFGIDANQLFIVMEYVPGTDLKTIMKQRGRLSVAETIELISQACAGLGYAHRAGLVHCDVKPQNMLVTPDMRLKMVDFGIARALASISPDEQSDVVWGSPQYFSPEQAAGGAPSPASDVYSLGVIMYEMLTGQLPFTASSPEELARLHREALPPSPRKFNPAIPVGLEQIVLKVLSKEPAARYRTADQLGRVLVNLNQHAASPPIAPHIQQSGPSTSSEVNPPVTLSRISPSPQVVKTHPQPPLTQVESVPHIHKPTPQLLDFDWPTWLLALLAVIAVGGLVPFWLWVYYVLNPPY
jgi:serine/threonine protein kinase